MDGRVKAGMDARHSQGNLIMLSLSFCAMAAIFSSTLSKTPTLPLFASHLGASDAQVGLIAAASTFPGIIMSYLAGSLSDRYGRKLFLLFSLLIFSAAPPLYLLVNNPLELAAVRFFHGFATAVFGPVAMAAITSYCGERKGEMLSFYSSSTILGRAVAPFSGGFLLAVWGFPAVFTVSALAGTAALILCAGNWGWMKESEGAVKGPTDRNAGNLWRLLCHRGLLLVGVMEGAIFFAYGAFEILFPLYARQKGLEIWLIGVMMGLQLAGVIFLKPLFGRLSDRAGRMPVILAGLALSAASAGGITLTGSLYGLGVMNIAFGLGFALVTSGTRPLATEVVRGQPGAALGILSTLMDIGQAAGPSAVGIITSFYGHRAGFLFMAAILTAVLIIACYSTIYKIGRPWAHSAVNLLDKCHKQ